MNNMITIEHFGAVSDQTDADCSTAINDAMKAAMETSTGATVWIPEGRWFCQSQILPPRGTNAKSVALRGYGKRSVLDFRRSKVKACIRYDGTGTDGPTHQDYADFRIRGNQSQIGMQLDFQSGGYFVDCF